jgi:hypothetical protein
MFAVSSASIAPHRPASSSRGARSPARRAVAHAHARAAAAAPASSDDAGATSTVIVNRRAALSRATAAVVAASVALATREVRVGAIRSMRRGLDGTRVESSRRKGVAIAILARLIPTRTRAIARDARAYGRRDDVGLCAVVSVKNRARGRRWMDSMCGA